MALSSCDTAHSSSPAPQDKTVVAITSGANMNFERLRLVSELANVGGLTEATLITTLPERAGAFKTFIDTVVTASAPPSSSNADGAKADSSKAEGSNIQVTEFKYRWDGRGHLHSEGTGGTGAPAWQPDGVRWQAGNPRSLSEWPLLPTTGIQLQTRHRSCGGRASVTRLNWARSWTV